MSTNNSTRQSNIYTGIFLILLGITFLLDNYHVIDIRWHNIWRLWPILLIFWGLRYFNLKDGIRAALNIGLMLLFFILLFFQGPGHRERSFFNKGFYFSTDNDNEDDDAESENTENDFYFSEEMKGDIKEGTVQLNLPALEFHLNESSPKLYELIGEDIPFGLKKDMSVNGRKVFLHIYPAKKDVNLSGHSSNLEMKLNETVKWNFDIKTGASDLELDLKNFKTGKTEISSGASSIDLTLGDKSPKQEVVLNAGASDIHLNVPGKSGVRIVYNNIFSSKDITGFVMKGKNTYETPGFNKAANKIFVRIQSAIGNFEVERY